MRRVWTCLALPLILAACSGGGGGSGPVPTSPSPTSTPNGSPVPTPTPSASTASVTGQVVDYDSGAPISGATVTLGSTTATTNSSGTWTVANAPLDLQYFQVAATNYATYNSGLTVVAPMLVARTVKLIKPTAEETSTLAEMNSFRGQNGAGPVAFDETAMEVSRQHALDMATQGYLSHWDTNGLKPYQRYAADGGVGYTIENLIGAVVNWAQAESGFEAEKAINGGHYLTLVDPNSNWAGLGEVPQTRYDQELVAIYSVFDPQQVQTNVAVGSTETIKFRSISGAAPSYGIFGAEVLPTPLTPANLNAPPYNGGYPSPANATVASYVVSPPAYISITVSFTSSGAYYIGPVGGTYLGSFAEVEAR